jgi:CheY-like chemotaxis protein
MREFVPDVALLDIGMPGMHGYELARLIRAEPSFAHTVLIAVTAWGREEDREAAFRAGFDDHLQKPVDLEQLKKILSE